MRVLWTHNFNPRTPNAGVFANTTARGIRACGVDLELEYLGNLRSVPQMLRARRRIEKLASHFDLVHAQYGSACAFVTAAAKDVPKVLTIRGSDWNVHRSTRGFANVHTRLASGLTKLSLDSYECVLSVSQRVASELGRSMPRARITVLPSPVDLTRFVTRDKTEAKALLGFENCAEKWVLFNSLRLRNPVKRFDLAKRAFDLAASRHGNLRLRLATDLPHEEMPLYVAACDVILCTSENEGWPNSIKEGLACNVPFVSTDVSDLREIAQIEPTCRVCPPDAQVLADNICEVLTGTKPRDLRRHVADMSLEATSDRLLSTYRSVLARY